MEETTRIIYKRKVILNSSCLFEVWAAAKTYLGSDDFGFEISVKKGGSVIEVGTHRVCGIKVEYVLEVWQ